MNFRNLIFVVVTFWSSIQVYAQEGTVRNQWYGKKVAYLGDSITDERHVGTTKNCWVLNHWFMERMDISGWIF